VDVGQELRQARERREISLQHLSRITKISPRVLQVLEAGDETRLPARVFTRSFVRTYAVEVGLDPDDTVRRYFDQFEDAAAESPEPIEPLPAPRHDPAPAERPLGSAARVLQGRFGTATVLTLVGLAVVVLAAQRREPPRPGAAATQPAAVATAGVAPATQPAAVGTTGSAAPLGALHIVIAPTGPCWVQATMNENRLWAATMNAGDRRTIDAPSEVVLRVGDPATFAFTIDGRPARIAGTPGQAVTVRIARDNYTQFLSR
jgi:cytoskeletal protein RodZ